MEHGGREQSSRGKEEMQSGRNSLPAWAPVFNAELAEFWSGEVLWNCPMASYTTFRVGGAAEAIIFPRGVNELANLIQGLRKINVPWHVLGRGSNVVVNDSGVKGVVIIFGSTFAGKQKISEEGKTVLLRVDAGHSLSGLINWAAEQGLSGLEFAAGIPGTVGGAVVMNAGAWGKEISDIVSSITMSDDQGNIIAKKREEINFGYRSWGEADSMIAVEAVFQLNKCPSSTIKKRCRQFQDERRKKQPLNMPSGGSFFKNPPGDKSAGQLIDEAGLKGLRAGGAEISPVHANFMVNTGSATASDIIELMQKVQEEVEGIFGIRLEPEVRFLGWE